MVQIVSIFIEEYLLAECHKTHSGEKTERACGALLWLIRRKFLEKTFAILRVPMSFVVPAKNR